jgi:hypothetical protein
MTSALSASERAELHQLIVKCVRGLHGGFPST